MLLRPTVTHLVYQPSLKSLFASISQVWSRLVGYSCWLHAVSYCAHIQRLRIALCRRN